MKNNNVKGIFSISTLILFGTLSMLAVSCDKNNDLQVMPPVIPDLAIATFEAKAITTTSAVCGGIILSDGGSPIIAKGICWSEFPAPTIADHVGEDTMDSDTIQVTLSDLLIYTKYYVRPYATNSEQTIYGEETSFTTQGGTVTDIDGNVYHTISIGSQVWMAENLNVTKYRNGDSISFVTDHLVWRTSPGAYCYYNNDTKNKAVYGGLYNWSAVINSRQLAPEGWHIPTDAEWNLLVSAAGGGGSLKEKHMSHWKSPNTGATNESGFTALPGGYRDQFGSYVKIRERGCFWSATKYVDIWGNVGAWYSYLSNDSNRAEAWRVLTSYGFSVRCVRD